MPGALPVSNSWTPSATSKDQASVSSKQRLPATIVSLDVIESPAAPSFTALDGASTSVWTRSSRNRDTELRSLFQEWITALPLVLVDALVIAWITGVCCLSIAFLSSGSQQPNASSFLFAGWITYLIIGAPIGLFRVAGLNPVQELHKGIQAGLGAMLLSLFLVGMPESGLGWKLLASVEIATLVIFVAPLGRLVARAVLSRFSWWGVKAVVIGDGTDAATMIRFLDTSASRGVRVVCQTSTKQQFSVVDRDGIRATDHSPIHGINDLEELHQTHAFRLAFLATGDIPETDAVELTDRLHHLIPNVVIPICGQFPSLWSNTDDLAGMVAMKCRDRLNRTTSILLKRGTDIVLAGSLLLVLTPLLLVLAGVMKIVSPGPVLFGHPRIGRGGTPFKAWKLRTMVVDADTQLQDLLKKDPELRRQWEVDQKLRHDPRVVPVVGRILRKTSLDELPQLWNVLRGEMSLVGPRPIVQSEVGKYRDHISLYYSVQPGITGLWQVSGRNDTTYDQRVSLDRFYVRNWSFSLDLYLLFRTIRTTVLGEGAY